MHTGSLSGMHGGQGAGVGETYIAMAERHLL